MQAVAADHAEDAAADLERRAQAIASLEAVVAGWDEAHRLSARALQSAIEELNKEALRRLIRALKDDPAANARLRAVLDDPLVRGVLQFHGLLKRPLAQRVARALDEVRPLLHGHGGDVELVAVLPPDAVEIRLLGSCHGCPASAQTLSEGIEQAIRAHCPEVIHVRQVSRGNAEAPRPNGNGEAVLHFVSPFARPWVDLCALDEIPDGGIAARELQSRSLLLARRGPELSCFDNACAHLGMPLEMGELSDGVLTCPYHGFRYLLETGECLTAREVQLRAHAVRLLGERVQVRLEQ